MDSIRHRTWYWDDNTTIKDNTHTNCTLIAMLLTHHMPERVSHFSPDKSNSLWAMTPKQANIVFSYTWRHRVTLCITGLVGCFCFHYEVRSPLFCFPSLGYNIKAIHSQSFEQNVYIPLTVWVMYMLHNTYTAGNCLPSWGSISFSEEICSILG